MNKYKMPFSYINEIVQHQHTGNYVSDLKNYFSFDDQKKLNEIINKSLIGKSAVHTTLAYIESICHKFLYEVAHNKGFDPNTYCIVGIYVLRKQVQEKYQLYCEMDFFNNGHNAMVQCILKNFTGSIENLYEN